MITDVANMGVARATTMTLLNTHYEAQVVFERIESPKETKVATGCPLCDEIWSSKEAYEYTMDWPDKIAIVMEDGKPWLYVPCEDSYYSDTKMQINYCPKCGRKLL